MSPIAKFAIIMVTIFLALLIFMGIWFFLYGFPQLRSHYITLHNVREDMSPVVYDIDGNKKTLDFNDNVAITVKNNTTITTNQNTAITLSWNVSSNYTDIYFFNESIETNLTTFKLAITNSSSDTFWLWIWPSQTPASIQNINTGKSATLYTYVGQQIAFTQSSSLGEAPIYMFSPTSLSLDKISLTDTGISIV